MSNKPADSGTPEEHATYAHVPAVILWHEPAKGEAHFDWMLSTKLQPTSDDDPCLITHRTSLMPMQAVGVFEAHPIQPHRAKYLWYEGPLSCGRGSVRRVWAGTASLEIDRTGLLLVEMYDADSIVRCVREPDDLGEAGVVRLRVVEQAPKGG